MRKFITFLLLLLPIFSSCDIDDLTNFKIMGLWVLSEQNNQDINTDDAFVFEFKSQGIVTYAKGYEMNNGKKWCESKGLLYTIDKKNLSITGLDAVGQYIDFDIRIIDVDSDSFVFVFDKKIIDGTIITDDTIYEMEKQIDRSGNYKIVDSWEGKCITDGVGELHRWVYFEDGTYYYYYQENGRWIQKSDNEGTYFVYGDLLCSNWVNDYNSGAQGPQFECWSIDFDNNDKIMEWEGRRTGNKIVKYMMYTIFE